MIARHACDSTPLHGVQPERPADGASAALDLPRDAEITEITVRPGQ
ncbi:hypothetical protein ACIHEI_03745 [Kitasatospora sp. NPDC051984]